MKARFRTEYDDRIDEVVSKITAKLEQFGIEIIQCQQPEGVVDGHDDWEIRDMKDDK